MPAAPYAAKTNEASAEMETKPSALQHSREVLTACLQVQSAADFVSFQTFSLFSKNNYGRIFKHTNRGEILILNSTHRAGITVMRALSVEVLRLNL